ncbi:hypothetical protein MLD38_003208 [Melastoma candidum]|uniref:Uncharacterized protein n=1 Tax=Melastoma candidum TaxID=119954 RepID=A0ACB9S1V3_9MYRT|nr:hypothetical protein MLD38_003208 [Melastoma candidum]
MMNSPNALEEKVFCHNGVEIQAIGSPRGGGIGGGGGGAARRSSRNGKRSALGKPTPSKWDDAQKWLVGISGDKSQSKPRDSNADDRRLIAPMPQEHDCWSDAIEDKETEKVECIDSVWRVDKAPSGSAAVVRSICVRDMGTEMTPAVSQDPSRTATPIRARTPVGRSPVSSGSMTPVRGLECGSRVPDARKVSLLESRAMAWVEAERAKYMARYKREELKIQAWENRQMRKAEMKMQKTEAKAERMKARAEEQMTMDIAATRRAAEEKRANEEAKLNEKGIRTSERTDYIRRTGNLPSSFTFKLPYFCR